MSGCPEGVSDKRSYERWLRRNGFSCRAAKRLARAWDIDDLAAVDRLAALAAEMQALIAKTKTACYDLDK